MRIYLDANVFISYVNIELGRGIRGLFLEAEQFFEQVKQQGHVLILSALFFEEVEKKIYMDKEAVVDTLKAIEIATDVFHSPPELSALKWIRLGIPRGDARHIALAIAAKCDCIVTFNIKDFEKAESVIPIFEPTKLI